MKYDKIFVIGRNKTATTTMHLLFMHLGLKCQKELQDLKLDDSECFFGERRHYDPNDDLYFKKIHERFPNALFILNTRKMNTWLRSKCFHWFTRKEKREITKLTLDFLLREARHRESYYAEVLDYFMCDPKKLLIINTEIDSWVPFLAKQIGFYYPEDIRKNVTKDLKEKPTPDEIIYAEELLQKALSELNMLDNETISIDNKFLSVYKNNIL